MLKKITISFKKANSITRLIYINIGFFLFFHILKVFLLLTGYFNTTDTITFITNWFALKADLKHILTKPWTLITFMFLHVKFIHLLYNILILHFAGKIFQDYLGEKKLLSTYILGGLAGAILLLIIYNISPVLQEYRNAPAFGASASAIAILIAIATYAPNLKFNLPLIGSIAIKHIALTFILIDIINFDDNNIGGHIGHLGGALWGFLYITQYKKGNDMATWFYKTLNIIKGFFNKKNLKTVHSKTNNDYDYNEQKKNNQKIIDSILDKISKSGYDSLTKKEKEILFKNSK